MRKPPNPQYSCEVGITTLQVNKLRPREHKLSMARQSEKGWVPTQVGSEVKGPMSTHVNPRFP